MSQKIDKKLIGAGVVLYEPDEERLFHNLEKINPQVDKIFLYANSNIEKIAEKLKKFNVVILGSGQNIGLAKALNAIMEEASEKYQMEWVVTFDQDSIAPDNMIEVMYPFLSEESTAIVCPQVIDKRRPYMKKQTKKKEYVSRCITSSSCTKISAWKDVGKFDENLFIDLIDNDFCKRLILKGWKILRINDLVLDQEFGNIELKSPKKVKFYMNIAKKIKNKNLSTNIAKLSYKKTVSPMRVYYSNRNIIYLNKKFKNYGGLGYDCYSCNNYFQFFVVFNIGSLIRGKQKWKILKAICGGIRDGIKLKADLFIE